MASATTRPSFSFNFSATSLSQPPLPKLNPLLKFSCQFPKSHHISATQSHPRSHIIPVKSTDISKEDKPISPEEEIKISPPESSELLEEDGIGDQTIDKRRLEEKFAVLNTGIYECRSCGYRYDQGAGDPSYPIPPGLPFDRLPDDWRCATCGASKAFFENKSVEIAGFAQNQQFGLGGNTLTSGQKSLLIWGSLALGFLFFLSGYFLQ